MIPPSMISTSASDSTPKLSALFGSGRCGTSWLGAILNSHPGVAYRFEPFHRLRHRPGVNEIRELITSDGFSEQDLSRVYEVLLRAHPLSEKPPFFRKRGQLNFGRGPLWIAARKVPLMDRLFERLYTPGSRPPLIFKEVELAPIMKALVERAHIRVVYLVRHPCGVIASALTGQSSKLMPSGRFPVLEGLLEKHDAQLAQQYVPRLDTLSPTQKNALLWRMDVERSLEIAHANPAVHVLVYENLCREPLRYAREVFAHLNLDLPPETEAFIDESTLARSGSRRHELYAIRRYFSVFQDPRKSMMKWQGQLSDVQKAEIDEVLHSSPAYQEFADAGSWVPITTTVVAYDQPTAS
jgi:hypothetical protein